jgi:16S rRNA (uracil1498-N3)-methyltransferase
MDFNRFVIGHGSDSQNHGIALNIRNTHRLYYEGTLRQDQTLTFGQEQAHYLQHVLRMKPGGELRVFNARDGEWRATVGGKMSKHALDILVHEQLRTRTPGPDAWLCCAPIKKGHFEYMIEKATEIGVAVIMPIITNRTQVREVNLERCRTIAIEAAEQSERLSIPEIRKPMKLDAFVEQGPHDRTFIVCAEMGDATPIGEKLTALRGKNLGTVTILTGPEGGFTPEEFTSLHTLSNAHFVRLGPRILRADTAAIAALSCWQAINGDWT